MSRDQQYASGDGSSELTTMHLSMIFLCTTRVERNARQVWERKRTSSRSPRQQKMVRMSSAERLLRFGGILKMN